MEAAQRALRKPDYDSGEDDVSSVEINSSPSDSPPPQSSSSSSSSIRQRGFRSSDSKPKAFDPYASIPDSASFKPPSQDSLFDATAFELSSMMVDDETRASTSSIPGGAGYLEIEEEPPRPVPPEMTLDNEPVQTSSGLLLTHRRTSPTVNQNGSSNRESMNYNRRQPRDNFEMEYGIHGNPGYGASAKGDYGPSNKHATAISQAKHLLSYAKVWIVVCFGILVVMTGTLMHSFGHQPPNDSVVEKNENGAISYLNQDQQQQYQNLDLSSNSQNTYYQVPEQILLLPMENISQLAQQGEQREQNAQRRKLGISHHHANHHEHHGVHYALDELRQEFDAWVLQHNKVYHSEQEKEDRFHIWSQNHHRTIEKNRRFGLCKMTKQQVFGSNHLKDLSPEEFKGKFLTGYNGPRTDEMHLAGLGMGFRRLQKHQMGKALDPNVQKAKVHKSVKQRMLQQEPVMTSKFQCKWYDASCILRWLYNSSGMQFGIIGTMEPKYDADAYPNAVDWRDSGAVTEVRYQGKHRCSCNSNSALERIPDHLPYYHR